MPQSESNRIEYLDYLGEIADRGRTMLLPALLEAQKRYGYIPKDFAEAAANELTLDMRDPQAKIPDYKVCAVAIENSG